MSLVGDEVREGTSALAADLVLASGQLGDFAAFEGGTSFLTQFHDDLGALLDSLLSELGDDASITDQLVAQVLARFVPALAGGEQRSTSVLILVLDPVSFQLSDPAGKRLIFDQQTGAFDNQLANVFTEVGGPVEVVVVPEAVGKYGLSVLEASQAARGASVVIKPDGTVTQESLTAALRTGAQLRATEAPGSLGTHRIRDKAYIGGLDETPLSRGRAGRAAGILREAIERLEEAVEAHPGKPEYRRQLQAVRGSLDRLVERGRSVRTETALRGAVSRFEILVREFPDDSGYRRHLADSLNSLARVLLVSLDRPSLEESRRAAGKAVDAFPGDASYISTLGAAQYRMGDWRGAVGSLQRTVQLSDGGAAFEFLYLAMAHWQLGDKAEAVAWHRKAVEEMAKSESEDLELQQLQVEAEGLMGQE